MYHLVMVIGVKHWVDMPKDKDLGLSEAAYRMEVYHKRNPKVSFLALDENDKIVMELGPE